MTTPNPAAGAQVTPNAPVADPAVVTPPVVATPPVTTPAEPAKPASTIVTAPPAAAAPVTDPAAAAPKADDKPADPPKPDDKKVVPDAYDLKLPDGSLLTATDLEEISSYAKEKGYTQEQASELMTREHLAVSEYHEAQQELFKAKTDEWKKAVSIDKELGGDNLAKSAEFAYRAVERFASPEFKAELDKTGFGNHPEVVRMFSRIGRAMSDDKIIGNGAPPTEKKSMEDIFYPAKK